MRRELIAAAIAMTAFASGCGGGSDRPPAESGGPGAIVTPAGSDGRLGGALIARPGGSKLRGRVQQITPKLQRPPAAIRGGVGAEDNCTDVDVQPTAQNLDHVSDVIFCLMNAMRANAGLPALREQDELADASLGHSQDMVDNKYFAHDSLDGRDLVARLKQVAYIPSSGSWVVGENLAWGSGTLATPKSLVNAWMNSPPHRENLLASDYREVGMGVVFGTPSKQVTDDGVTVTTDFGTRPEAASDGASAATAGTSARASRRAAARHRAAVRKRRARALRRCKRSRGAKRRRCVRAARRIR